MATSDVAHVIVADRLDADQTQSACELVDRVTDIDGVHPLSEHVWLHLRHGGDPRGRHVLAFDPAGILIGYGHLDTTDEVEGPSGEVVVDPDHRRRGVGARMIDTMLGASGGAPLRLWAHGQQAAAGEWARSMGFSSSRVLWQMRRSLRAPLAPVHLPDGVILRAFIPGTDDDTWVALNTRAFADHPEQGQWTVADLRRRIAEPWFSSDGFLIAEAQESGHATMVGFHWTKVHGAHQHAGHGHEAIGEVYVIGVDPAWQGRGLGRSLTLAGLHHLRSLGLSQAMLYVEESNTSAIALYESLGFARWDVDVLYQHPGRP